MIKTKIVKISKKGHRKLFRVLVEREWGVSSWPVQEQSKTFGSLAAAEAYATWLILSTPNKKREVW